MEKVERFIIKPSIKLFGGVEVTKETEFETWNDSKTVHQTLKDLVLTTEVKKEWDFHGMKSEEESKLVQNLPEGIVLIWSEDEGYIIPQYRMSRISEAVKDLEILKGVEEDDARRKQENSASAN